jgi:Uma2 family endonuclease
MSASAVLQSTLEEELEHVESPPVKSTSAESRRVESPLVEPPRVRWTRERYHQMGEMGWFQGKRVQLIGGEIFDVNPTGDRHWIAVNLVAETMRRVFATGFIISVQSSLRISAVSEPEPDVAVVQGDLRKMTEVPSTAELVIEVSDTTLRYDRSQKASLYASARIPEYWVVDLLPNQLIVHRRPQAMDDQPFGFGYASIEVLSRDVIVEPSAAPQNTITVSELLP